MAFATYDTVSSVTSDGEVSFNLQCEILEALAAGEDGFTLGGVEYTVAEDGSVYKGTEEVAYASRFIVQAIMNDVFLTRAFKEELVTSIQDGNMDFVFTDEDGTEAEYTVSYDAASKSYAVMQTVETKIFDTYASPSKEHWLGTDRNGMDMLTRLMYGGRVSLYIGFIVVIIETVLGVILGGLMALLIFRL